MTESNELYIEDEEELAVVLARWITDAETAIERLAAETGQRQEQSWGMEGEADRVFLRVLLACEPREFAARKIEGDLAAVAERALAQNVHRRGGKAQPPIT